MLENELPKQYIEPPANADDFINSWNSGDHFARDSLADVSSLIMNEDYAGLINDHFISKYETANKAERADIVYLLDRLGAKMPVIDRKTTQALVDLIDADDENIVIMIKALQNKTQRAAIKLLDSRVKKRTTEEDIAISKDIFTITGEKYIEIISGNYNDQAKDRTWRGMWYCATLPEYKSKIESALQTLEKTTQNEALRIGARTELENIKRFYHET